MTKANKDVLFLCQFFYPEHNTSATLPFDTAKYLCDKGLSVSALVGYPKEYAFGSEVKSHEIVNGVEINRIKYLQLNRSGKIGRLINYFSFTIHSFLNLKRIKNNRAVIVYSNPPVLPIVPIIAKKLYGTKIVFVAYDIYPEVAFASHSLSEKGVISRTMRVINHYLYKNADCVIALTEEMKRFLLDTRKELTPDRIITIPNWAHEKEYKCTSEAYERFGYDERHFIVSYFGNMGICQDVETMMKAAECLKNDERIRFLIVGHGSKKNYIHNWIKEKDLKNVQLLDFLIGEDFQKAVSISSCTIVSLERGLKGTCAPSKYYSYLQGGQPIIAIVEPDSYIAEELKTERIGYSVDIGDEQALKAVIIKMANNKDECEGMGERAKELYRRKYDMCISLDKYVNAIHNILR